MIRYFLFAFLVLTTCTNSGFSQSNYRPAYMINNSGDTIKGFINHKEWLSNPTSFSFKNQINSDSRNYSISEAKEFGISQMDTYKRYVARISLNKTELNSLPMVRDTTYAIDTVFLKVLQSGKNIVVYSYQDKIKERYYIQRTNALEDPKELYYNAYRPMAVKIAELNVYRDQLFRVAEEVGVSAKTIEPILRNSQYIYSDIIKVTSLINGSASKELKALNKKTGASRFFVGAGINRTKFVAYQDKLLGNNYTNPISYSPTISAGFDLLLNPNVGKWVFRGELSGSRAKVNIQRPNRYPFILTRTQINFIPQIIYYVYNARAFKAYLGAGASLTLLKDSPLENYEIYSHKFELSFPPRLGFSMQNIELSFTTSNTTILRPRANDKLRGIEANFKYLIKRGK